MKSKTVVAFRRSITALRSRRSNRSAQGGERVMRAIVTPILAMWTCCACASPYLYQKEVGSFSSSVVATSDGLTQGFDNLDQDQAAADLAQVVSARAGVNLDPACGQENSRDPCRVLVPKTPLNPNLAAKFADVRAPEQKVVATLKAYAEGLAAVTNAQDRREYDAAASQLASSVAGLGTALGAAYPPAAASGPALSAAVTLVTSTIGGGLDAARYDTLRSAINAVGVPSIDLDGKKASAIEVV